MLGTTVHDVPLLVYRIGRKAYMRVLLYALSRWYHAIGSQHSPQSHGGPQVEPEDLVVQHSQYHYKPNMY